jgi:MFS family permease
MSKKYQRNLQYYKFCLYGFLKNLKFFDPFLILFFIDAGLSFLQIGTLYAIREISTNILEIPTGIAADSMGRRKTMICSFIFYIISFALFFYSDSYLLFIPAMILFAFGEACRTGTHKAMIFEYLKINNWQDQKVHYYGDTRSWSQIGSAVSALIAGGIVFLSADYKYIFAYSILPYLINLLLMISYPKELDGVIKHHPGSEIMTKFVIVIKTSIHSFINISTLRVISSLSVFSGFHRATKDYLQPVLAAFALSLPIFLVYEENKRTALVIGIAYFFIYILTAFASRKSGKIAAKFQHIIVPLNISMLAGLVMGVLIGIFYNLDLLLISIILYIGIFIIQNLRKPMGIAYVSDMTNQDILATTLSAESQVTSLFSGIIAVVIGYFADRFGLGTAMIVSSFVLLVLTPLYRAKEKVKS